MDAGLEDYGAGRISFRFVKHGHEYVGTFLDGQFETAYRNYIPVSRNELIEVLGYAQYAKLLTKMR